MNSRPNNAALLALSLLALLQIASFAAAEEPGPRTDLVGPMPLLATTRPTDRDRREATIELDPSTRRARLLEPIVLDIRVLNRVEEILRLPARRIAQKDYVITLTDERGKPVPLTRYGRSVYGRPPIDSAGVAVLEILKGKPVTAKLYLNRIYDLTVPGKYLVSVHAYVFQRGGTQKLVALQSVPQPIEIASEFYDPDTTVFHAVPNEASPEKPR
jgi:hypothetical protein